MPWDWFIIDLSYVLVLIGGAMIFRARGTTVGGWMAFGALATFIGVFLFTFTWQAQVAFAQASQGMDAVSTLSSTC